MAPIGSRTILLSGVLLLTGAQRGLADEFVHPVQRASPPGRISIGGQVPLPIRDWSRDAAGPEGRGRGWPVLLAFHGASVLADLVTTRRALERGASEGNPLYGWAGDEHTLTLRAEAAVGLTYALHHLHKNQPRLARGITWAAIVLNVAVAAHNAQQVR